MNTIVVCAEVSFKMTASIADNAIGANLSRKF